jgi:hypothetical protein
LRQSKNQVFYQSALERGNMSLSEIHNAKAILEQLRFVIRRAESSSDFEVQKIDVQFSAAVVKTAGVKNPEFWILPKDLIKAELSEKTVIQVSLTLTKFEGSNATLDIPEEVARAIEFVREAIEAVEDLRQQFTVTAKISFDFAVTASGGLEFIFKAGGSSENSHKIALEVRPKNPV